MIVIAMSNVSHSDNVLIVVMKVHWPFMIMHMKRSSKNSWPFAMSKYIIWFHYITSFEPVYNMRLSWRSIPTLIIAQSAKMLDIMSQNWTTGQKFFDQVVMAGAMFAQYISRSKDQHRVFVHSGQSSQIHTGWDVIQTLFLSSNIKSYNLREYTHEFCHDQRPRKFFPGVVIFQKTTRKFM